MAAHMMASGKAVHVAELHNGEVEDEAGGHEHEHQDSGAGAGLYHPPAPLHRLASPQGCALSGLDGFIIDVRLASGHHRVPPRAFGVTHFRILLESGHEGLVLVDGHGEKTRILQPGSTTVAGGLPARSVDGARGCADARSAWLRDAPW
eukprot:CAMPEP_0168377676 /NCGR_PEP_ID=MMETSP0228-20121227/10947_1 /TAXON_ID=133427 /ORGANISM="Protoceratium reticulatum, Strain CCCM 535 (=CCMP 1889)" /LENGTH=148 /DNA_ID=CAMNT_0008390677 /DNA_START=54 /DNA_END=497 /DNA_ORIENTATION=-